MNGALAAVAGWIALSLGSAAAPPDQPFDRGGDEPAGALGPTDEPWAEPADCFGCDEPATSRALEREPRPAAAARDPGDPFGPPPRPSADYGGPDPARGRRATLFRDDSTGQNGVFMAPRVTVSTADRKVGAFIGLVGGFSIVDRVILSGEWQALVSPIATRRVDGRRFDLAMSYGGLGLDVNAVRVAFFRLELGSLLGGGTACLRDERLDRCYSRAQAFVAQPRGAVVFSLVRILRLRLSGGYRFVVPTPWSGPDGARLGGFTAGVDIQIGSWELR